jgi:hypothetical protein
MNVNTGRLVGISGDGFGGIPSQLRELMEQGYEPVPEELEVAANKKLAGQKEAYVSLTSGGKLSTWAAGRRKENRKSKRKAAKQARRRNRG